MSGAEGLRVTLCGRLLGQGRWGGWKRGGGRTGAYFSSLSLSIKEIPILADVVPPLGWDGEHVIDGVDRANRLAVGAIDAGVGIDEEHFGFGGELDAVDRAHIPTPAVLDPNARLGNHERHMAPLVEEAGSRVNSAVVSLE